MAQEGFYAVAFAGHESDGFGILVLDTGIIVGADAGAGLYDGTYQFNPTTGLLDIDVVLTARQEVHLVVGGPAVPPGAKIPIKASVPVDLGILQDHYFTVTVMGAPVNVKMFKLRDFPD